MAKKQHPEITILEQQLEKEIAANLGRLNLNKLAKTTGDDTVLHVPVVFHLIHDNNGAGGYPSSSITDEIIYQELDRINKVFNKQNSDTAYVTPPYTGYIPGTTTRYIGNTHIMFHMATQDPWGNPTKGITRRRSYLTYSASDYSKIDLWPTDRYLNIWLVSELSSPIYPAYTYKPASASQLPYWDGIIGQMNYIGVNSTYIHEIGHYLGLDDVWGGSNNYTLNICGDDGVDDTPPSVLHFQVCAIQYIYDTTCANGYTKTYTPLQSAQLFDGDTTHLFVNYPDTVNFQNMMDFSYCRYMFTNGQALRMRTALKSNVANRSNLFSAANLAATGALAPLPDLPAIPEFAISKTAATLTDRKPMDKVYGCMGNTSFSFTDKSWGDTIVAGGIQYNLTNAAATPAVTTNSDATFSTKFSQPGWVSIIQSASGNNTPAGTKTFTNCIYVADSTPVNPGGTSYFQEFSGADSIRWPSFNYYNNRWKWQLTKDAGYYDNYSMMYNSYDTRIGTPTYTETPAGDVDDFFSPVFNLTDTSYNTNCNLNFMYATAARSTQLADRTDTFQVFYSTNCGDSWTLLNTLTRDELATNGSYYTQYKPTSMANWHLKSIPMPAAAKQNKTMFRFRYRPGNSATLPYGGGNDFYIDRIHISSFPTGFAEETIKQPGFAIAPNPTQGSATVIITGDMGKYTITITDVSGKIVYKTETELYNNKGEISIPPAAIQAKGIYMVRLTHASQVKTGKLSVF